MSRKMPMVPDAHLLLTSLRSVGYTEETAIADIIDNCIAAGARHINLMFDWDHQRIVIADNGSGMSQSELLQNMKIGSTEANQARSTTDLGRFGMGMKTASFSLGKKLLVITKQNNVISNAAWDLESINEWNLSIFDSTELASYTPFVPETQGTVVIIENLDRMNDPDNPAKSKNKFYNNITKITKHLSLVFHRFIEEDDLEISINNNLVDAWNPFQESNPATQELGAEEYYENKKVVVVEPFVLPHKSKFTCEDDFENAGRGNWRLYQGFYVYRNRRLIVFGTWFGRIKKEPAFNLARIKLDILSESDFDWGIDIKKSKAVPPVYLDDIIDQTIDLAIKKSAVVYNSRGTYAQSSSVSQSSLKYVWEQRKTNSGKYMFYLNKKHPMLMNMLQKLDEIHAKELRAYLSLVENMAPSMLSGVHDTMNSAVEVTNAQKEKDLMQIKALIDIFKSGFICNDETYDTLCDMPEFSYLKNEIKAIVYGGQ